VCHCGPWYAHDGVNVTAAVDAAILAWNTLVAIAMPPPAKPDYQQRVIDEKAELDARLTKLSAFIDDGKVFVALPNPERERMIRQERVMLKYSEILGERIAAFPPPGADATTTPTP
jgi:hypothetical protein